MTLAPAGGAHTHTHTRTHRSAPPEGRPARCARPRPRPPQRWLKKDNLEVTVGEDGQDLVERVVNRGQHFDVVLLDEHMRRMNGSTATSILRKHERDNGRPHMAVLVTTGNSSRQDMNGYMAAGFDGMLSKPLQLKSLVTDLRAFLDARAQPGGPGREGAAWTLAPPGSASRSTASPDLIGNIVVFPPPPSAEGAA